MASSDSPKIYAGMLKKELLEVAAKLGLRGVSRLRKAELLKQIQSALKRPRTADGEPQQKSPARKKKSTGPSPEKTKKPSTTRKKAATPSVKKAARSAGPQPETSETISHQARVTASKYGSNLPFPVEDLRQVDASLPGLPEGYGEDRMVLLPRDPEWLYTYWDLRNETKEQARDRGGANLSVRLYETRGDQLEPMSEHLVEELSRSWYIRVPSPGQTYVSEIGYRDHQGQWLKLLQSNQVSVPPAGPSTVIADRFMTLSIDEPLKQTVSMDSLIEKGKKSKNGNGASAHEAAYRASVGQKLLPGSMQAVIPPGAPTSAYSGPPWAGSQHQQAKPPEEKDFWLVADAELIVFGATEPDAKLMLGGQKIKLRPDGTFSLRMAFPDGTIGTPIVAVAADDEQTRSINMRFERNTSQPESVMNS